MATLTITTTAEQDSAVQWLTDRYNNQNHPPTPVLPKDFALKNIMEMINGWVARVAGEKQLTKGELYQKATPTDQATIDTILAKYQ
jgi:hypothetical protein